MCYAVERRERSCFANVCLGAENGNYLFCKELKYPLRENSNQIVFPYKYVYMK